MLLTICVLMAWVGILLSSKAHMADVLKGDVIRIQDCDAGLDYRDSVAKHFILIDDRQNTAISKTSDLIDVDHRIIKALQEPHGDLTKLFNERNVKLDSLSAALIRIRAITEK